MAIDIGEISINPKSRMVYRHGEQVLLTPREYAILEYLAMRRGEVVSRTSLYEHLFDENGDTLSNLLDVHVHGIRRKIRLDFILTRRGEGYYIPSE